MISRRNLILGIAVVGLLTAAGYTVWTRLDGGGEFVISGVIEADDVHVGSKVGGRVPKVTAKEGQGVKAGDVLVLLPYELKASLAESQASLRQAEARLAELVAGYRREEIDQAKAEEAEQKMKSAKERYDLLLAGTRQEEIAQARAGAGATAENPAR